MSRRRSEAEDGFEDLLDGRATRGSALAGVLSAARAPGTPDELGGLSTARTAFLTAQQAHPKRGAAASGLPGATRSAAGRLLVLKAVAAVSGATLVGGVAYAATGAHLLGGDTDHRVHSPATSPQAPAHYRPGVTSRYPTQGGVGNGTRPSSHPADSRSSAAGSRGPAQPHSANPSGPHKPASPGSTHTPNPHSSDSPSPHPSHSHRPHPTNTREATQTHTPRRENALRPSPTSSVLS